MADTGDFSRARPFADCRYNRFVNNKADYTELSKIVSECFSVAQVCKRLGLKPAGGNYKTVVRRINDAGISSTHFTGSGWNVGVKKMQTNYGKDISSLLVIDSPYQTYKLKRRLIKEGIKSNLCERCGVASRLGQSLSLELDHINGINTDNRLCNLRILCPNCHSQTETWRGRNKRSALLERASVESP